MGHLPDQKWRLSIWAVTVFAAAAACPRRASLQSKQLSYENHPQFGYQNHRHLLLSAASPIVWECVQGQTVPPLIPGVKPIVGCCGAGGTGLTSSIRALNGLN